MKCVSNATVYLSFGVNISVLKYIDATCISSASLPAVRLTNTNY